MNMYAHTPGPWEACSDPGHFDTLSSVVGGLEDKTRNFLPFELMVEVGGFAPPLTQEANTRLISAAPELLEASKLALSWFLDHDRLPMDLEERRIRTEQRDAVILSLQTAIAKAKGESK